MFIADALLPLLLASTAMASGLAPDVGGVPVLAVSSPSSGVVPSGGIADASPSPHSVLTTIGTPGAVGTAPAVNGAPSHTRSALPSTTVIPVCGAPGQSVTATAMSPSHSHGTHTAHPTLVPDGRPFPSHNGTAPGQTHVIPGGRQPGTNGTTFGEGAGFAHHGGTHHTSSSYTAVIPGVGGQAAITTTITIAPTATLKCISTETEATPVGTGGAVAPNPSLPATGTAVPVAGTADPVGATPPEVSDLPDVPISKRVQRSKMF